VEVAYPYKLKETTNIHGSSSIAINSIHRVAKSISHPHAILASSNMDNIAKYDASKEMDNEEPFSKGFYLEFQLTDNPNK